MYPFTEYIAGQITSAFEQLLNRKHLYQHVDLDLSGINPTTATVEVQKIPRAPLNSGAKTSMPSVEEVIELGRNHAKKTWFPQGGLATEAGSQRFGPPPTVTVQGPQHVMFSIPSVQTFCSHCEGSWPFNHIDDIVKEVPEPQGKFFAKAIMAYNTGQTLAGIFFLRTFIEQFWRSIPGVQMVIKEKPRATGDEQGDAYQATLLPAFRDSFPSLPNVYGRLSAAMHEANADAALFESCRDEILHHFDGRKAFRLDVR
jgi:hypothetical protein